LSRGRMALLGDLAASYVVRLWLLLEALAEVARSWAEASFGW